MVASQTRDEEVHALMTIGDNEFQVLTATTLNNKEIPNDNPQL